jgi:hypothetical protein
MIRLPPIQFLPPVAIIRYAVPWFSRELTVLPTISVSETFRTSSPKRAPTPTGLALSVQFFVTNDLFSDIDELARVYDHRAGIEPLVGELKNGFAIGKASSADFTANEAAFLIKLLAYNLMRRWTAAQFPTLIAWRSGWIRRLAILIPARLLRSGGRWIIRRAPRPMLN